VIRDISRSYVLRFPDKRAKECVVIEGQRENVGNDTAAGRLGPLVEDVDWARRRDVRGRPYTERSTRALTVTRDCGNPSFVAE